VGESILLEEGKGEKGKRGKGEREEGTFEGHEVQKGRGKMAIKKEELLPCATGQSGSEEMKELTIKMGKLTRAQMGAGDGDVIEKNDVIQEALLVQQP
jgi:hypothetical protein